MCVLCVCVCGANKIISVQVHEKRAKFGHNRKRARKDTHSKFVAEGNYLNKIKGLRTSEKGGKLAHVVVVVVCWCKWSYDDDDDDW